MIEHERRENHQPHPFSIEGLRKSGRPEGFANMQTCRLPGCDCVSWIVLQHREPQGDTSFIIRVRKSYATGGQLRPTEELTNYQMFGMTRVWFAKDRVGI